MICYRTPCFDSAEEAVAWLAELGCTEIKVHIGPDGSYRGSGVVRPKEARS